MIRLTMATALGLAAYAMPGDAPARSAEAVATDLEGSCEATESAASDQDYCAILTFSQYRSYGTLTEACQAYGCSGTYQYNAAFHLLLCL